MPLAHRCSRINSNMIGIEMNTYDRSLAPKFTALLALREAELRSILQADHLAATQADMAPSYEVADFKDAANDMAAAVVEEAKSEHAAQELQQVLAAQRRLEQDGFGNCLDCGQAIDLRRLLALPAASLCTQCQSDREAHPAA